MEVTGQLHAATALPPSTEYNWLLYVNRTEDEACVGNEDEVTSARGHETGNESGENKIGKQTRKETWQNLRTPLQ
jgi:hypothetical protein